MIRTQHTLRQFKKILIIKKQIVTLDVDLIELCSQKRSVLNIEMSIKATFLRLSIFVKYFFLFWGCSGVWGVRVVTEN